MSLTDPKSLAEYKAEHFINREISWLSFNERVLEEAQDLNNPLLERMKFLAIFSSNLDEFFMVRVAGLREQAFGRAAAQDASPDSMRPIVQLAKIAKKTRQLVAQQHRCWEDSVRPALAARGIEILHPDDLKKEQRKSLDLFFNSHAFPVLTPMAIDPSHPSPRFHNRGLYLIASLERMRGLGPPQMLGVVQIPQVLPRLVEVSTKKKHQYVLLEDVIAAKLNDLFGGYETIHHATFRITRDMDIELLEQESEDMLQLIEARVRARRRTNAVRLEVPSGIHPELLDVLVEEEEINTSGPAEARSYSEVYFQGGMLDMTSLFELTRLSGYEDLRDPPFTPKKESGLRRTDDLFAEIAERDILLHHPFDSFDPVIDFIDRAARDPKVLAIKQTLYRTSGDSPVVQALMEAAESGKHVTALVELKARFDESNNITWARQLERAGVHVVFGFLDLKTHCKIALVVRQEANELQRYVHLSTGNYNPVTAGIYTDIGLFTADPVMADDVSALFNLLTGYSQSYKWNKLSVAPQDLRNDAIEQIERQAATARRGKPARIIAKLNSLVDRRTIEALYTASQAGVSIDLIVRGICCLRPGVPGVSDNIRVRSIVERFLEHSRIFVFGIEKKAQVFLSSADWMPRNFDRRVEIMFPVEDTDLKDRILNSILPYYLQDNQKARLLLADGSYTRAPVNKGEPLLRAQTELLGHGLSPGRLQMQPFSPSQIKLDDLKRNGKTDSLKKAGDKAAGKKTERKPKKKQKQELKKEV